MKGCRADHPSFSPFPSPRHAPTRPSSFRFPYNCNMGFCGRVWCNYHDPIGLLTMPIVAKGTGSVILGLSSDWVRRRLHDLRGRVLGVRLEYGRHPPVLDCSLLHLHGRLVWSQGNLHGSRTRRRSHRSEWGDALTCRLFQKRRRSTTSRSNPTTTACRHSSNPLP